MSVWHFGRFDVYAVNPPLVRMVAALPVLAAKPRTDWSSYHAGRGARAEFPLGEDFVRANGERSLWLMTLRTRRFYRKATGRSRVRVEHRAG